MATDPRRKFNIVGGLWLFVLLLIICISATSALVGSFVGSFSDGRFNVVALIPNEGAEGYVPEMKPSEDGSRWECYSKMNLFENRYVNERGEVTIESANGDAVIAPGSSNRYEFSLKNTGDYAMDYRMKLDSVFEFNGAELPFYVRLSGNRQWLIGDERTWVSVREMQSVEVSGTMERGKYASFILEWQWPFENSDEENAVLGDLNDTLLGNSAAEKDIDFSLHITTIAEIAPNAYPMNNIGMVMLTKLFQPAVLYSVLGILLLIALIVLIILILKSRIFITAVVDRTGVVRNNGRSHPIAPDGRFMLGKVFYGKQKYYVQEGNKKIPVQEFKIIRDVADAAMSFAMVDGTLVLFVGKRIKAIELFFVTDWGEIKLDTSRYSSIDINGQRLYHVRHYPHK